MHSADNIYIWYLRSPYSRKISTTSFIVPKRQMQKEKRAIEERPVAPFNLKIWCARAESRREPLFSNFTPLRRAKQRLTVSTTSRTGVGAGEMVAPGEKKRQQKDRAVWFRARKGRKKYLKFSTEVLSSFRPAGSSAWEAWTGRCDLGVLRRVASRMQLFHCENPSNRRRFTEPSLYSSKHDELLSSILRLTSNLLSLRSHVPGYLLQ